MTKLNLFDAVRIARLPDGRAQIPAYYSQTGCTHITIGDIGVVIGNWPNNQYRVEAVDSSCAIVWQDHFKLEHLDVLPATASVFSRRRINQHWAEQLSLRRELLDAETRSHALKFARKVMLFAKQNVELLAERLDKGGYQFASKHPVIPPEKNLADCIEQLSERGVHIPIALQAWMLEIGQVDFCGTHPEWPRTAFAGMYDDASGSAEPWFTDPLVISFDAQSVIRSVDDPDIDPDDPDIDPDSIHGVMPWLDIAPDHIHKANVSGGAPIMVRVSAPSFDNVLVGQHGSLTLLSYLRLAFDWGGFPGFEYIPDRPTEMLKELSRGLTRL
jgi:hypothetical protein